MKCSEVTYFQIYRRLKICHFFFFFFEHYFHYNVNRGLDEACNFLKKIIFSGSSIPCTINWHHIFSAYSAPNFWKIIHNWLSRDSGPVSRASQIHCQKEVFYEPMLAMHNLPASHQNAKIYCWANAIKMQILLSLFFKRQTNLQQKS